MATELLAGFHYLLRGFSLLNRKGVKRFVYIPIAINLVLYCIIFTIAGHYFLQLTHWVISKVPSWLDWLSWVLWPLFVIAACLAMVYTFVILANLVGAPFNSLLAEKIEQFETGADQSADEGLVDSLKDIPRSIRRQLKIIAYTVPRVVVLLLLLLVPGVNVVISIIWFLFSAWMMALQYADYPMDLHRISFSDMQQRMRLYFWKYLSFGCCVTVVMLVPIVNFFAMPAAVIAATLMFVDEQAGDAGALS